MNKLERKLERCMNSGARRVRDVYLFKTENNMYKIGVASNTHDRLKGVQTGCPTKVKLVFNTFTYRALNVEAILHEVFKKNRVIGEWFKFSDNEIEDVINEIKNRVVQRRFTAR